MLHDDISAPLCYLIQKWFDVAKKQLQKHIREIVRDFNPVRTLFLGNMFGRKSDGCYNYNGNIFSKTVKKTPWRLAVTCKGTWTNPRRLRGTVGLSTFTNNYCPITPSMPSRSEVTSSSTSPPISNTTANEISEMLLLELVSVAVLMSTEKKPNPHSWILKSILLQIVKNIQHCFRSQRNIWALTAPSRFLTYLLSKPREASTWVWKTPPTIHQDESVSELLRGVCYYLPQQNVFSKSDFRAWKKL